MLFKHGTEVADLWLLCYVAGNVVGVSSAVLWMAALKRGKANVTTGLAVGRRAFLMRQIALVVVYGGSLTLVQDVGIAAILGGILCLSFGARAKKPALREEDGAPRPAHVSRVAGWTGSAEPY